MIGATVRWRYLKEDGSGEPSRDLEGTVVALTPAAFGLWRVLVLRADGTLETATTDNLMVTRLTGGSIDISSKQKKSPGKEST